MANLARKKWSEKKCLEEFDKVCTKTHKKQCIFFMNAMWTDFFMKFEDMDEMSRGKLWFDTEKLLKKNRLEKSDLQIDETEKVWIAYKYFCLLEKKNAKRDENNALDEMPGSHRLLELMGQPLTVIQFRKEFKKIDQNFDKRMSMIEYLVYKYNPGKEPKQFICDVMKRPQAVSEILLKAQAALADVQAEIEHIEDKKAEYRRKAKGEGRQAAFAKKALANLVAEQKELDELKEKEKELLPIAAKGGVKGMKAKQELNILNVKFGKTGLLFALRRALLKAEKAVEDAQSSDDSADAKGSLYFCERELAEIRMYKPVKGM